MLGVFDLRKSTLYAMSDSFEVDLNAVVLVKENKKVLTAASDGAISIFSWDWFGDCNDRIVGHPNSVECMVKYDENTVITGGEDGLIRAISVLPNRVLALLGDPLDTEDEIFPVQKATLSHCKTLLASCSLDDIIKVIDVTNLADRPMDGSFNLEAYERQIQDKLVPNHGKVFKGAGTNDEDDNDEDMEEEKKDDGDDWSDADSDDDDSDDMDSDSDDNMKHKKKNKKLNPKGNNVNLSKKMLDKEKAKDFFRGM